MIQELIDRAKALKNSERLNYEKISDLLEVSFSKEFIEISSQVGFDYFGLTSWLNSDQTGDYSMIGDTLFLRKEFNLPLNTVIIANEGESILLMKCFGKHEEIWWIDNMDIERFCKGEPLEAWNKVFPTFITFFQYLLDEEEKSRAEDEIAQ